MIADYRDHAANERTYLAWVRTAVTTMALGFFIEKFNVYLARLRAAAASTFPEPMPKPDIHSISVLLVVLGIALLAAGTYRFVSVNRKLETRTTQSYAGLRYVLVLSVALGALGVLLLLHLLQVV